MITKEEFFKFIDNYNQFCKGIENLEKVFTDRSYSVGLFECDWIDSVSKMLDLFIYSHFTEEGSDWINYYLFETISDKKVIIKVEGDLFEEEKEIVYHLNSLEDLWNFLLINKDSYFKNV